MQRVLFNLSVGLLAVVALIGYAQAQTIVNTTSEVSRDSYLELPTITMLKESGDEHELLVYPAIAPSFKPMTFDYEIIDGESSAVLEDSYAKELAQHLGEYAKYYQAPWHFLKEDGLIKQEKPWQVKLFDSREAFLQAITSLSGSNEFNDRKDFITVIERDGEVVLYAYRMRDARRMHQLLKRQGFVQFASYVLPALPSLLRDGFSLYFEDIDLHKSELEIIRNRTFMRNISEVPNLYTSVWDEQTGQQEYLLSDSALYGWLLINYMYQAYSMENTEVGLLGAQLQQILQDFEYTSDERLLVETTRANNKHFATTMDELFNHQLEQRLSQHLERTLNHHQAYLAGIEAFKINELNHAKSLFSEAAFGLAEYYQPRYAIARIALYQVELLQDTREYLLEQLTKASSLEKTGYELEIQVVEDEIAQLMQEAKFYFNQARVLIDHRLNYEQISFAVRQELEEFRGRIINFYSNYTQLRPMAEEEVFLSSDESMRR